MHSVRFVAALGAKAVAGSPLIRNPMTLVRPCRSCILADSQRRERWAGFSELVPMGGVRHGRTKSASKQLSRADQPSRHASAALSVATP